MWSEQREREKFVEMVVGEIIQESTSMDRLKYQSKGIGERDIKSMIYRLLNVKVKKPYPMSITSLYDEKFKDGLKREFFRSLEKY
jgi:hypothetical protein